MNRYAWTNIGPVRILQGAYFTTAACRSKLAAEGIVIEKWARNWADFLGWYVVDVFLPFTMDQANRETDGTYDFSAQISPYGSLLLRS